MIYVDMTLDAYRKHLYKPTGEANGITGLHSVSCHVDDWIVENDIRYSCSHFFKDKVGIMRFGFHDAQDAVMFKLKFS